jgi:thymidylate kinase
MELQGEAFQQRVRNGFLEEAAKAPERMHVIDAARTIDIIQQEIRAVASRVLGQGSPTAGSRRTQA